MLKQFERWCDGFRGCSLWCCGLASPCWLKQSGKNNNNNNNGAIQFNRSTKCSFLKWTYSWNNSYLNKLDEATVYCETGILDYIRVCSVFLINWQTECKSVVGTTAKNYRHSYCYINWIDAFWAVRFESSSDHVSFFIVDWYVIWDTWGRKVWPCKLTALKQLTLTRTWNE